MERRVVDPDAAAARLSKAHETMTDAEIRGHACALAIVAASADALSVSLFEQNQRLAASLTQEREIRHNMAILARQAESHFVAQRDSEGREIIQALAKAIGDLIENHPVAALDQTLFKTIIEAWPDAYSPKGSKPCQ